MMDQSDLLDASPAESLSDWLLIRECRDYLSGYEQPKSYFSGDNRMAELAGEVLYRFEEEIKMETNEPNETNIERVEGDVNVEQQDTGQDNESQQDNGGEGDGSQDE